MINWANWNSLVNPGGKLTSVVPIDFWLLNSSSRLQNAIPGKTVCKVLLSTLPSWKTSFMSMLAAKKILQKCQIDVNSTATSFRTGDCKSISILFRYIKQYFYNNLKTWRCPVLMICNSIMVRYCINVNIQKYIAYSNYKNHFPKNKVF